jgi:hypothetical protein
VVVLTVDAVVALVVVVAMGEGSFEVSTFQLVQAVLSLAQGGIKEKHPFAEALGQVAAMVSQKFLQGSLRQRLQ